MEIKQRPSIVGFNIRILFVLFSFVILAACGGGGSGGSSEDGSEGVDSDSSRLNTITGQFVDGPVSGLHFKTVTQSGVTNEKGEFLYLEGETVSFSVGDIVIGSSAGATTVTPFDLAGLYHPKRVPMFKRRGTGLLNSNAPHLLKLQPISPCFFRPWMKMVIRAMESRSHPLCTV